MSRRPIILAFKAICFPFVLMLRLLTLPARWAKPTVKITVSVPHTADPSRLRRAIEEHRASGEPRRHLWATIEQRRARHASHSTPQLPLDLTGESKRLPVDLTGESKRSLRRFLPSRLADASGRVLVPLALVVGLFVAVGAFAFITVPGHGTGTGADGSISLGLSPTSGTVGQVVTLSGSNFPPNKTISATYAGLAVTLSGTAMTTATGGIPTSSPPTFTIPATAPGSVAGAHTVVVTVSHVSASTTFTVKPQITVLSETSGFVGDTVTVSGNGFKASQSTTTLKVVFNGSNITMNAGSVTDANGTLSSATFTVPAIPAGIYTVAATDGTNTTANFGTSFTVKPQITVLSETSGFVGDTVTVSGNGFAASQTTATLSVIFGGTTIALSAGSTTNPSGTLSTATFTVPTKPAVVGGYTVKITDGTNTTAAFGTNFAIAPQILTLSETSGFVGDTVTVSGNGFAASQTVSTLSVNFNGTLAALNTGSTTNASGVLSTATFTVPPKPAGSAYTVKITDGTNTTAAFATSFTVKPQITVLSETSGFVGDTVTVSGNGFKASQSTTTLKVVFNGSNITMNAGSVTDANGTLSSATFTVPAIPAGIYTVAATDGTNTTANFGTSFTVKPQITVLSETSGFVGDTVTVSGNGFAASQTTATLSVIFGGTTIALSAGSTTNPSGTLSTATFTVPTKPAVVGGYTVKITDGTNTTAAFGTNFAIAPQILTLSETSGFVGDTVTVSGNGFAASQTVSTLSVNFNGTLAALNTGSTTNASGVLSTATFTVPPKPAGSAYTVKITDGTNTTAAFATSFTVKPQITVLSETSGFVGDTVTVSGNGFKASQSTTTLKVVFNGSNITMNAGSVTDANGTLSSATFTVPAIPAGIYTVAATDGTNTTANFGTSFTVKPQITVLSETTGFVGDTVTVSGNGFKASQTTTTLKVVFNGSNITMNTGSTTNPSGTLSTATFTVPAIPAGIYTVAATDGTNTTANFATSFTVKPQILTLSETTGFVGDTVTVSGNGFKASQSTTTLKVVFNGSNITMNAGSVTDANGTLSSATFTVPAIPAGIYTVAATDGTNTTANFGTSFTVKPQITVLSETTGFVGDTVTVSGNGFKASQTTATLKVVFNGSNITMNTGSTTNPSGTLSTATFTVPAIPAGIYTVAATDGTNTTANFATSFTVKPQITVLSETSGFVGDTVTVSGNGFKASQSTTTLKVVFNGSNITMNAGSVTDANGTLSSATFTVPAIPAGIYTVAATDGTNTTANFATSFTVKPQITVLSETTGFVGDTVTVSGNGFKASQTTTTLKVVFNGSNITMNTGSTTNPSGTLSTATFTVPAIPAGIYTVAATDGTNTTANFATSFTVNASAVTSVTFSASPATPGSAATWTVGFTTSSIGALASGNTITAVINTGNGIVIPSTPTITLPTGFSHCSATASTSGGNSVLITLANSGGTCALPASTAGTLTIAGITNPSALAYPASDFSVATAKDAAVVNPGSGVTIQAATVKVIDLYSEVQTYNAGHATSTGVQGTTDFLFWASHSGVIGNSADWSAGTGNLTAHPMAYTATTTSNGQWNYSNDAKIGPFTGSPFNGVAATPSSDQRSAGVQLTIPAAPSGSYQSGATIQVHAQFTSGSSDWVYLVTSTGTTTGITGGTNPMQVSSGTPENTTFSIPMPSTGTIYYVEVVATDNTHQAIINLDVTATLPYH